MRLILFFLVLSIHVSAQDLKYIPDVNLRKALIEQGFTTNDSLDLYKIRGRLQLNLNGKGIVNLDGLQYFERLRRLSLYNNEIENLDYLPHNLVTLNCSHNKIKEIKKLPKKIIRIDCNDNEISLIENLPRRLEHINFSNNKMTYLPKLPVNSIVSVNYAENSIPFESLPIEYQEMNCLNSYENCLPYKFVKWNILDTDMVKLPQDIKRMTIQVDWGYYKTEIFDFDIEGSKFIAEKVKVIRKPHRMRTGKINRESVGTTYTNDKYSADIYKVQEILNDIYTEEISFTIPREHDTIEIDMSKKKRFCIKCRGGRVFHDSHRSLHYVFYTGEDAIELKYYLSMALDGMGLQTRGGTTQTNVREALDWFYMYKLANLTLKNHEITKMYFNEENLERSVEAVRKEY